MYCAPFPWLLPSHSMHEQVIITTYQTLCLDFVIKGAVDPEDEARWLAEYG
jgi:hypothetical protein